MSTYTERVFKTRVRRGRRVRNAVRRKSHDRYHVRVFRSGRYIYADLYDSELKSVIVGLSSASLVDLSAPVTPVEVSFKVGEAMAELVRLRGVKNVTFDRGPYKFHGRVAAVANGLRKGGCLL